MPAPRTLAAALLVSVLVHLALLGVGWTRDSHADDGIGVLRPIVARLMPQATEPEPPPPSIGPSIQTPAGLPDARPADAPPARLMGPAPANRPGESSAPAAEAAPADASANPAPEEATTVAGTPGQDLQPVGETQKLAAAATTPAPPSAPKGGAEAAAGEVEAPARFPKRATLYYQVFYNGMRAGTGRVEWENTGNRYRLETRLTPVIGPNLRYVSEGSVTKAGLRPDSYTAWRNSDQREHARFDWSAQKLEYGDRESREAPLAVGAQDILSVAWQLALRGLESDGVPLQLTTGKKVYQYPLTQAGQNTLKAPRGPIRAIVVQARGNDEETEFWLAPELSNLPVRILRTDNDKKLEQRIDRIEIDGKSVW